MKTKYLLYFFFLVFFEKISAQKVCFMADIQPIIQKKCTPCHHADGSAPFSLTSYEDCLKRRNFIKTVTETRYMPPWFADTSFSHFKNERILTQNEIEKISLWAKGKKEEKSAKNQTWLPFIEDAKWDKNRPKIVIPFNKPFLIPNNNQEQFRVFVLPTNADKTLYIKGIEFLPDAKKLAHHNRVMIDTTRLLRKDDGIEVGASSEFERLKVPLADQFWHGWVPGRGAIFYPKGIAKILPKNADLVINMHYAPSSREISDQSKLILYPVLENEKIDRIAQTFVMTETDIVNEPFEIAADTIVKFYMRSPMIPYDLSLLSVLPHGHLLLKNFKCYAITPDGDLLPMFNIPKWDFNWQMNYQFKHFTKLPKGSVVFAEAEYDNTQKNPKNPFSPSQKITYGWGTKNEMMNVIFEYVPYRVGDELLK
jgi:hypothetical protein